MEVCAWKCTVKHIVILKRFVGPVASFSNGKICLCNFLSPTYIAAKFFNPDGTVFPYIFRPFVIQREWLALGIYTCYIRLFHSLCSSEVDLISVKDIRFQWCVYGIDLRLFCWCASLSWCILQETSHLLLTCTRYALISFNANNFFNFLNISVFYSFS